MAKDNKETSKSKPNDSKDIDPGLVKYIYSTFDELLEKAVDKLISPSKEKIESSAKITAADKQFIKDLFKSLHQEVDNHQKISRSNENLSKDIKKIVESIQKESSLQQEIDNLTQVGSNNQQVISRLNHEKQQLDDTNSQNATKIRDLENIKNNLEAEIHEKNKIYESGIERIIKDKGQNEIIEKVLKGCKYKPNNAYYALFLIEKLFEAIDLQEKYPEFATNVFKYDFESNIAQLVSLSICESIRQEELDEQDIGKLIEYINNKLSKYEIIASKKSGYYDSELHESIHDTDGAQIQDIFTLPVKVKDQITGQTGLKKALVDAKI